MGLEGLIAWKNFSLTCYKSVFREDGFCFCFVIPSCAFFTACLHLFPSFILWLDIAVCLCILNYAATRVLAFDLRARLSQQGSVAWKIAVNKKRNKTPAMGWEHGSASTLQGFLSESQVSSPHIRKHPADNNPAKRNLSVSSNLKY